MFRAARRVKLPTYCVCPKCNRLAGAVLPAECTFGAAGTRSSAPLRHRAENRNAAALQLRMGTNLMSAFEDHKEELEHYEQMFGRERGRLAVSLDRLTNALVLVGQHGVYCTSQRNPTVPAMDIRIIANELTSAKELVQSVMEELRQAKNEEQR
jgi:hypothetical protein